MTHVDVEQPDTGLRDLHQSLLHLKLDGWCLLDNVIPADRVDAICDSVIATVGEHRGDYPGAPDRVGFVPGLINHNQSFAPYLAEPRLLQIAEQLLGEHVRISYTSAIINEPGNARGNWHADWPFNQNGAGRIPAPYPDAVMHLTTLWMLSPFTFENGGTLVVPGSHRTDNNPTGNNGIDAAAAYPTEMQVTGGTGSVLVFDSRLWHATASNTTDEPRVALAVRYAPKWLNLDVLLPGSDERKRLVDEAGGTDNQVPGLPTEVYIGLPKTVRPLYRHWVRKS